jgi:mono/diheme cytochrome c family protein
MKKWLLRGALVVVALFVVAQAVPYGRNHANPAPAAEPRWDSATTRQLARRACFDCHSDLTTWPWYSNVAPVSWLVYADVKGGRAELDFTHWNTTMKPSAAEVAEIVRSGEMPPFQYVLMHRNAKLSASEQAALARGLEATIAQSPSGG